MTKSKAQPLLREARIISQDTLRPDHLARAMLETLEGFDASIAREMREKMPSEPEGVTLAPHEAEAWRGFHDLVTDELENEALAHGWSLEASEGDGVLLLLRPMYTPKELATELLEHLEERTADNGEPYVTMPERTGEEVLDDLWDEMTDDPDWRMASLAAYQVLDEAAGGVEPAVIEDRSYEYANAPSGIADLLTWYQARGQRGNYVAEVGATSDLQGLRKLNDDPIPSLLQSAYEHQMIELIQRAARALDEAAEEFNS